MTETVELHRGTDAGAGVLGRVRALAPEIRGRAAASEERRRVAPESLRQLIEAGCFRLQIPARLGGEEASLPNCIRVYEEVARADSAAGWVVMILSSTPLGTSRLPVETFDAIYANPDVLTGGSVVPKPMGEIDGNTLRVSGQWPLASGSEECDWVIAHAIVFEGGQPRVVDGVPDIRLVIVAPEEVEILDTWHVVGLRGTGSHDIRLRDVVVTEDRWCNMFGPPSVDSPLFRLPMFAVAAMQVSAVALGIAQAAVDELAELAGGRRSHVAPGSRTAEDPIIQFELGAAETGLRSARSLVYDETEKLWARALAGDELTPVQWVGARAAGWYATKLAVQAVDAAYSLGGSSALYDTSALQRYVRDIRGVTQHYGVNRTAARYLGAVLAGEPPDPMALR
jgi:indole-3-acetate monooxygenase